LACGTKINGFAAAAIAGQASVAAAAVPRNVRLFIVSSVQSSLNCCLFNFLPCFVIPYKDEFITKAQRRWTYRTLLYFVVRVPVW
jgi:hypothetical protein